MKVQTVGKLLIALGLLVVVYALNMPVSSGYSGVVNLHLMNQKQNTLILGGLIFISGIILFAVFKIKQTKEDEQIEAEARDAVKQQAAEKLKSSQRLAKTFFDRITDAQGVTVNSLRDYPIARGLTGIYVGFCLSLMLGDIYEYGTYVGLPLALWLSFRPRAARLVIAKLHTANIGMLIAAIAILYIQDNIDVFSYNTNSIIGLLFLIPLSGIFVIYAKKRIA